jgi:exodeoxyribonuclease-3
MKIISWNVNGIRAILKKEFSQSIKKLNPDILCLQETKAPVEIVENELVKLYYENIYANEAEKKGYSGTALLSKQKPNLVTYGIGLTEHDKEGRVITTDYDNFYLVNVYVPNSGQELKRLDYRKKWNFDFITYLKKLEKIKPLVLCGDLNVAHRSIDLKNDKSNYNKTAGYTQTEIDGMDDLINAGFIDVFRYFNPDKIAYTYWSYRFKARERNTGWRIDYFLVSKHLVNKIKSVDILSDYYGSDHCPIQLELNI